MDTPLVTERGTPRAGSAAGGNKVRVAVAGASGFAGQELLRLMSGHPRARITAAMSSSPDGPARSLPALAKIWDGVIEPFSASAINSPTSTPYAGSRGVHCWPVWPWARSRSGSRPPVRPRRPSKHSHGTGERADVSPSRTIPKATSQESETWCFHSTPGPKRVVLPASRIRRPLPCFCYSPAGSPGTGRRSRIFVRRSRRRLFESTPFRL